MPKLFPTSLVGSYAQPEWLIDRKKLAGRFPPRVRAKELWRVAPEFLEEAQDDATLLAIRDQERAGLDIITDGEMRRESYSNRFATALEGVDLDNPGTALDRSGHPNPGAARRRQDPPQACGGGARPRIPEGQHRPHGEDDGARPLHHVAAGAERLLRQRRGAGARLRRGGERGDQGPLRRRRRHRADRRALHAGAPGEGAPIRAEGGGAGTRRRHRHEGAAHLLRLRGDHPRAPGGLLVPAGACRHAARPDLDRDRAVEARHVGA